MSELISVIIAIGCLIGFLTGIGWALSHGIPSGGSRGSIIASSMIEMDRLIRPSSEHVIQAEEEMRRHEDGIGGE